MTDGRATPRGRVHFQRSTERRRRAGQRVFAWAAAHAGAERSEERAQRRPGFSRTSPRHRCPTAAPSLPHRTPSVANLLLRRYLSPPATRKGDRALAELHLLSPAGFRASGVYAGIKSKQTPDVALLIADAPGASAAAVFTTNRVFAAPVKIGRAHVPSGRLRGVVVNAGNANACTGRQGERDALRMCELAARVAGDGATARDFLPSSTGIIGHLLPMEKLERGIIEAGEYLGSSREHALLFADAILTT